MASLIPTFEDIRKKNRENALNAQSKTNYWSNIDNRPNSQTQSNTLKTLASLNNDRANSAVNVVRNTFTNDNSQKTPSYDLNRSAVGGLRDNDSNFSYFTNKSFKSVLGDNADTSKMTYQNLVDTYNNASGDQQADIKKAISDEIITQRDYAKNGQQGSLKVIDYLNDLNSTLEKHGNTKGKSLLRQIGDYAATGGIVNTLGRGVSELVNNIGGAIFGQEAGDKARANLEKMDNSRKDLGAVGVADTALATAANYGANLGTGGLWGLANAGIGGANAVANTINDKTLAYDDNGNAIIRHKTDLEKAGELGNAALDAAFAIAGKKGIGPSLEPTKITANGLSKLSAKDIAKYAAKELPWAGATTYLQQGLSNISQGRDWGNMDAGEFTKDFLLNLGQDVGMDAANYGAGKIAQRNMLKSGNYAYDTNGNMIKRDSNGQVGQVSDTELAQIAKNAASQNTLTNKALNKLTNQQLLNELGKNTDLRNKAIDIADDNLTDRLNFSRRTEMANAIQNGIDKDINGVYMRQKAFEDANTVRKAEGKTPYNSRQTKLYAERTGAEDMNNYPKGHYSKHLNDLGGAEQLVDTMERSINGINAQAYPAKYKSTAFASETANQGYYPASTIIDGNSGIRSISDRKYENIRKLARNKSELLDGDLRGRNSSSIETPEDVSAGFRLSSRQVPTDNITQNNRAVNSEQQEKFDNLRNMLAQKREIESNYNLKAEFGKYDPSESLDEIKTYHKKYGDDFYEKMPIALQEDYDALLDMQPRDKNGVYTDPITGGKTIDEEVRSDEFVDTLRGMWGEETSKEYNAVNSARKLSDVTAGRMSFEDYLKEQRELLWKSFKDSNRGTDTFYTRDENGQINGRHTVSENGTLYRKLYDEIGKKPTKGDFNDALDDVIKNGNKSVYYDGFREFDPGGKMSVFGFNQGNEGIDMILAAKDLVPETTEFASLTDGKLESKNEKNKKENNMISPVETITNKADEIYTKVVNRGAIKRLARAIEQGADGNIKFVRLSKQMLADINEVRTARGLEPLTQRQVIAYQNAINNNLNNRYKENPEVMTPTRIAEIAFNSLTNSEAEVLPGKGNNTVNVAPYKDNKYSGTVLGLAQDGGTSLKSIEPRTGREVEKMRQEKNDLLSQHGSPLTASQEGGVTQSRIANSNDSATSLVNRRADSPDTPLGVLGSIITQNSKKYNEKHSKLAENTSKNTNFSKETRKALKDNPLTYKPTTNEERLARANKILSIKSADEIDTYLRDNYFNVADKDRNSGDVVLAGEFIKLLDGKGQYDRSSEIVNKVSEILTKQGQQIQAASLIANRSPEGIANLAQSAIKKGGGNMTGELRGKIIEKTQEIGKIRAKNANLAEENAKITEQIMSGKGDLKALRERQMQIMRENRLNMDAEARQFSQVDDIVGKNTPDNRSVFGSVYRASLLSGPRTHTGNLVSNTVQNALNATTDRLASGIDLVRSKITGKEREVVSSAGGRAAGLKRGLKAAGEVMKTGNNLWESGDTLTGKSAAWGQGGELEFKNKIANTMVAKPTNFVFRAMSAGDLPFRYTAFENAIRTEAKRQGINKGYKGQMLEDYINSRIAAPDPELQAYGRRKGNESVYDADTLLSKGMNAVDRVINSIDNPVGKKAAQTAKTLIAPFVKVPSKVLSTAIDYSPLGTVQALVKKIGSKNYTTAKFETDLARSGFGTTALVGLGYALSAAGLLTGGYPDDQTERNRWKAEGIEPNSVKIGDKYVSLNYLGPMAILTAMGAGVQQRMAKGEDAWTVATGTVMDSINSFLDQSYVQGLNNAVQAVTDSQRYGESYLNSLARGLTPNLLRQTATATDSKQRQVNNPGEAIISGIPGLSQTLDAKVDTYGREIENKQTLPLGQMWDALKISNSRETNDVIDEVSRLHGIDPNNADYQITPTAQQGSISVNGTNVKLANKQKTQLQKDTGEAALVAMAQVMKSSEYAGLTDDAKAAALKKAQKDAQKQARKQFIEANNISAENNLGTTNSGGKVTEDYTAKAISSATSNGERKNGIKISDSLSGEHKSVLEKYNSMSSEDWEKYVYGNSPESATAEYSLAKAKYENDLAKGELTDVQKIKRQKELAKLEISRKWTKDVRDVYSLAGTKADIQELLDGLDSETREKMVGMLNGLNNAMYEAGAISKSTYNSRGRNINNLTSGKSSGSKSSGISSAEASALKSATKALSNNASGYEVKTLGKPTTSRQMAKTAMKQIATKSYTPKKATISVKKGK